jgi:hypothetical protein
MFNSPNKLAIRNAVSKSRKQDDEKSKEYLKNENLKYFDISLEEKNEIISMSSGIVDIEDLKTKYTVLHSKFDDKKPSDKTINGIFNLEVMKKNELVKAKLTESQIEHLTLLKSKKTLKNREIIRNLIRDN